MSKGRKVTVTKDHVITYAELWHTSRCLLEKGQAEAEGSFHQFMASLVFTPFTLEAYLKMGYIRRSEPESDLPATGSGRRLHRGRQSGYLSGRLCGEVGSGEAGISACHSADGAPAL